MAEPAAHGDPGGIRKRKNASKEGSRKKKWFPLESMFESEEPAKTTPDSGTYWLTRIIFLRSLGFIYAVAFLVSVDQNRYLLGQKGLLPVDLFLEEIKDDAGGINFQALTHVPTILWMFQKNTIDFVMEVISYTGLFISIVVMVTGAANAIGMFILWLLYHSIVNVGQRWYSFGWESQLLETGFLAIFFVPVITWKQLPRHTIPPWVAVWGYRWLLFRIMVGAGLIKIRGDQCWRDFTCMYYHYETQPVPSPVSYYLHQTPKFFHQLEVLANHIVELILPWCLFLPRPFRMFNGFSQIMFQVILIISGNLSFLNWLTILPAIPYFDDKTMSMFFDKETNAEVAKLQHEENEGKIEADPVRKVTNVSLALCLAYLSIPVVLNLISPRQAMNTSFEPLRIVNTYGAFGSITKVRTEVILEGTYSTNPSSPSAVWEEYQFKCKPGDVSRRPCLITPYHYRLDWLMWFAAFQNYRHNPWLVHLAAKLLVNDEGIDTLMAFNPFAGKSPPKYVRAQHYKYKYAVFGTPEAQRGQWWTRKFIGEYMPAVSLENLKPALRTFHWDERTTPPDEHHGRH